MAKHFEVALHCESREYHKVLTLGTKVNAGMAANAATFPNPNPALSVLSAALTALETCIGAAKTGDHSVVANLHKQSKLVFGYLKTEKAYVNAIAGNDQATILLSGFDSSEEGGPKVIPAKLIIKRVLAGPTANSAKIMLETIKKTTTPTSRTAASMVRGNMYVVDMTTTPLVANSYTQVLETTNSKKLIVPNLTSDVPVWFRVAARNTKGLGPWSDASKFTPL